jgi:hypothetical protein
MYGEIAEIVGVQNVDTMILEDDDFAFPSSLDEIREIEESNEVLGMKTTIEGPIDEEIVNGLNEGGYDPIYKDQTSSSIILSF